MPLIYTSESTKIDLEKLENQQLFDIIAAIPSDSEDELDVSSDEETGDNENPMTTEMLQQYLDDKIEEVVLTVNSDDVITTTAENIHYGDVEVESSVRVAEIPGDEQQLYIENETPMKVSKIKELLWKKKSIGNVQGATFAGNSELPQFISDLQTPYQFFKFFFEDQFMQHIVDETIKYSVAKDPAKPIKFDINGLNKFIGICILTSVVHMPNVRMYWNSVVGLELIKNTLSSKSFENIRSVLHFNDNALSNPSDKLYKLRPIIDHLSKKFVSIPMDENLSIDEQICATKARHHLKQYLPLKPHKWGYKLYILCSASGFCYKFEIYTGTENDVDKRLRSEPDLGASSNIVVRLTRNVPVDCGHKVFFDNYYTSVDVVSYLAKKGIHSLGTVRRNRIPSCKLPSDKE